MAKLLALDFDLGPDLEGALRDCVATHVAFCVLDRRLSPRRRDDELTALGATHRRDANGVHDLDGGREVDDEVGLVMLTSGSSGTPKAAELTWAALEASAQMTNAALRGSSPSVWYPVLPACHVGGLAVLLRAIFTDASLLWGDVTDLAAAPSRGATHVSVVRPLLARYDLSGYARVLLGGAKPPSVLDANVVATWGMTETGSGVVYDGVALPGVEIVSARGELLVRSPTLFRGYRDAPRPRAIGPDGRDDWFPTGDGGVVDEGRVRVFGRLGSLINTGGEKLWPESLEAVLSNVEGVLDVAVTGVDDEQWGQRVVALVVANAPSLDRQLRAVAEERIGPWAKPKEIRYVTAIPRTSNGKIRRGELANLF
ncbi:MAG: AMP-binding protein [Acidobacteriota bacterium]|nr:AMP-binding protein [Acidobacteriota bacterium]MDE3107442.1 AMP-binding protein [Acidobacteriota bacterium]MDE3222233.1 AMP-binding protein [Acidobacteriota bacterium]